VADIHYTYTHYQRTNHTLRELVSKWISLWWHNVRRLQEHLTKTKKNNKKTDVQHTKNWMNK